MRLLNRSIATLSLLFAGGCTSPAEAEPDPRPAMWRVADADTRIYLFGTVHLLPDDAEWRSPAFDRAFAAADTLVLEIEPPADPAAHAARYRALAISPGLPPLIERVPAARRAELAALIERAGFAPGQLDPLESWAAAITLGSALYSAGGLSVAAGVETVLRGDAAGKRIVSLETMEQQLGFFDVLPEPAQRDLLLAILDEADGAEDQFDALVDAWTAGDVDEIADRYVEASGMTPALTEALLDRRNAAWARWIAARLDQPGTVMVAVGAGHLAGEGSVVERLRASGLTVSRVQ